MDSELNCNYDMIQTPVEVWKEILTIFPVEQKDFFFEPFRGDGNLYNQINSNKDWCEITEGKDIFDYDFKNSKITKLYTNPPFKCKLTNKKGITSLKNCVYFFLEKFISELPLLVEIGFLINAKSFLSLTPKRLSKLNKLGFYIHNIICLNIQKWYGRYFFILFKRETNNSFLAIEKYF